LKKRILVFGKGLLGGAFEDYLPENFERYVLSHQECDIMNIDEVRRVTSDYRPDVIVNTAAISNVDYCESHAQEAFIVNSGGAGYIAAISRDRGIKVVHISTDYVFDGEKGDLYSEEDTTNPLSVYGKSKYEGENLVQFSGADYIIARVQWLFGEHRSTFIDRAIENIKRGERVEAVVDQYGSPTYTRYVVYAIARLINLNSKGIFHIASEGVCSRVEQLSYICDLLGLNKGLIVEKRWSDFNGAARRPYRIELSKKRLLETTGISMPDWKSQTREYILKKYTTGGIND
jgi:dTDP-4-dehydrorhamnose reductase